MDEHLARVSDKIEDAVFRFCLRFNEFHLNDLSDHVRRNIPNISADSPSRILRDLKRRGLVNYEVVDRKNSLYRVTATQPQGALF